MVLNRNSRGFTLIELMLVVALIGILASLAIGLTVNWRRRNQLKEVTREIYNGLNRGRAEAIKRNSMVKAEFTPDRMNVFSDGNQNNIWDTAEALLFQFPIDMSGPLKDAPGITMTGSWPTDMTVSVGTVITTANGGLNLVIFDAQGFHIDVNNNPLAGDIALNDTQLGEGRNLDITVAGALRIR